MARGNEPKPGPTNDQHSGDTTESGDESWALSPSHGVSADQHSGDTTESADDSWDLAPRHGVSADHVAKLESPDHESPGDVQEEAGTSVAPDGAGHSAAITNEFSTSSDQPRNNATAQDPNPQSSPPPIDGPADEFPKFRILPGELRTKVWEQAFLQDGFRFHPPFPRGSIQRFRFDLRYDPDRVKPGKDVSRGWVACFTPVSVNTRPYLRFLRVNRETRALMSSKGKIEYLTVHRVQLDAVGWPVGSPSKCQVPFNFARDVFCVEGINSGFTKSDWLDPQIISRIRDKSLPLVWRPPAQRLENALGLRFAPRIKRLAIIPQYHDPTYDRRVMGALTSISLKSFMSTRKGRNMAALAKRFPSLVSVRSAIPVPGCRDLPRLGNSTPGFFEWYSADLRGRRQGGPTGMSEEDRNALYETAWARIFNDPFFTWSV